MDRAGSGPTALVAVVGMLAAVAVLGAGPAAGPVAADHGGKSNYTVVPHDRNPGNEQATYEQHAVAPISFEYLDYIGATWSDGGFTGCGATNSEVFGIDRGDDRPGTEYDEDLTQYVEEADVGEDRFYADFYEQDDAIGTSTHLYEGDEFVSVTTECFDNPDEPGWYRITSDIGGTAPNGTYIEAADVSHYFAVCHCEDRGQARDQLGPPPSEQTPMATPTATSTVTAEPTTTGTPPEDWTPFPSPTATEPPDRSTPTATGRAGQSDDGSTAGGGATADDADDGGDAGDAARRDDDGAAAGEPGGASTVTATIESWGEYANETPSVGAGPGLGPVVAVLALLAAALIAARR